jgi:hypothetical protein
MRRTRTTLIASSLALLMSSAPAYAQLNSAEASALLTAVLPESLSVTLLPPATTFVLQGGSATNTAALPLVATTTWVLSLTRTNLTLYGYFTNASAALAHSFLTNTVDIPSSRVEASVNGGTLAAFDQTTPFGGSSAGVVLFSQTINAASITGVRADSISLNINLLNFPMAADTYIGTLHVRAQATP